MAGTGDGGRAERARIDARVEQAFGDRLRLIAPLVGGWAVIAFALQSQLSPHLARLLWPAHLLLIGACAAAWWFHRRGHVSVQRAIVLATALSVFQVLIFEVSFFVGHKSVYLAATMVEVLAAGALHVRTRWMVVSASVTVAGWLIGTFAAPIHEHSFLNLVIVVAATSAGFVVHGSILRSLRSVEAMRALDERRSQELAAALAAARHELAERQRAEAEREVLREQFTQAQKMEAIGTLAGGVAHDMNNVLGAILGLAEILRDDVDARHHDDLEQLVIATQRGADLTRNLLGFSRRGKYRAERVVLETVVEETRKLLGRTLPKRIALHSAFAHGALDVHGDGSQLGHMVLNLCLNAADAIRQDGTIRIATEAVTLEGERARALGLAAGPYVALTIADDGCGMDEATRRRVFEPFFTTKPAGKGTGLGLAMVYGTVQHHQGAIEVDSAPGQGTRFTIHLPAVARRERRRSTVAPVRGGSGLVLLVDDEPLLRAVARRALERLGYAVVEAGDGREGVARFLERRAEIRLVVLDMSMPVMGGAACFRALREHDPQVRVLLCSGYAIESEARACLEAGAAGFLDKPFRPAQLAEAVEAAMRGGSGQAMVAGGG